LSAFPTDNMDLKPHSKAWYERLATLQEGYYYPWRSILPPFNGEDVYLEMVGQQLSPDKDVLDVGCGHGEVALDIAPHCRSVLAYDRVPPYIELARSLARERGVNNATFLCADSSPEANGGRPRIPAEDNSFDLIISRRGPINWFEDARRVARPRAMLLMLNPNYTPAPVWNDELPEALRFPDTTVLPMRDIIEGRLAAAGLELHSCWEFDVPEIFTDPNQLYIRQTWGRAPDEVPSWGEVKPLIDQVFRRYANPEGLELRFLRFSWQAIVQE
jgi:SAM-dependent methyltransferase